MVLELMNFSLTISLADGSVYNVSQRDEIQHILNQARIYNEENDALDKDGDSAYIDISLDPVNAIQTYSCRV